MSSKFTIMIGLIIGSTIGGYMPTLWGGSAYSGVAIIGNLIGDLIGIWAGFKFYHNFLE